MCECNDPLNEHFFPELPSSFLDVLKLKHERYETSKQHWTSLGQLITKILKVAESQEDISKKKILNRETTSFVKMPEDLRRIQNADISTFHVCQQIVGHIADSSATLVNESNLTSLQLQILSIICSYRDFYFTDRNFDNEEQIRLVYCLHALNHVLKAKIIVQQNNFKLKENPDCEIEFRDQGFVQPRVLIVIPHKDNALSVVKMLTSLLFGETKQNVVNKQRFYDDFSSEDMSASQRKIKPDDYQKTFKGNTDDDFKIGISVTKKSLKLYTDFYSSDIIIASPLGLRRIIKADTEKDHDYDFLSSIELLIFDQVEILYMQNWEHVLHLVGYLNLQPNKNHGTDITRIKSSATNGWSKYYRQNLIFCANPLLEISALFDNISSNYAGRVQTNNPCIVGSISRVIVPIPQLFYKLPMKSATETPDERFNVFVHKLLPQCRDNSMKQVLIYIPSYHDFLRVKHHFDSEAISCAAICEYTKDRKVAQARDQFFHNEVNYLLFSERFQFYFRINVKGIRHIIFYQIPSFPHFYSEMCNMMQEGNQNPKFQDNTNTSITVLYSKYDIPQLAAVVSTERAAEMFSSEKDIHMLRTEDN